MAWDVISGVTKTAWDVMSGATKTAWDVLSGVSNLVGCFVRGVKKWHGMFCPAPEKLHTLMDKSGPPLFYHERYKECIVGHQNRVENKLFSFSYFFSVHLFQNVCCVHYGLNLQVLGSHQNYLPY